MLATMMMVLATMTANVEENVAVQNVVSEMFYGYTATEYADAVERIDGDSYRITGVTEDGEYLMYETYDTHGNLDKHGITKL